MAAPISIPLVFSSFDETWSPRLIASIDSAYDVKIAKIDDAFIWHAHPDSAELFYLLRGDLTLEIDGGDAGEAEGGAGMLQDAGEDAEEGRPALVRKVAMKPGDVFVVPKGVRHRPVARQAEIMMVEKRGTVNTGDVADSERTRKPKDVRE